MSAIAQFLLAKEASYLWGVQLRRGHQCEGNSSINLQGQTKCWRLQLSPTVFSLGDDKSRSLRLLTAWYRRFWRSSLSGLAGGVLPRRRDAPAWGRRGRWFSVGTSAWTLLWQCLCLGRVVGWTSQYAHLVVRVSGDPWPGGYLPICEEGMASF